MKKPEFYYIITFQTTADAMQAEKYAKTCLHAAIMPVPREVSSGCGLALRFIEGTEEDIISFCQNDRINGTLYKMYTKKSSGKYPIQKIDTRK